MRMPPNLRRLGRLRPVGAASMEGGMRMPPNLPVAAGRVVQIDASMEGGMRMPPNGTGRPCREHLGLASMEGGMRMPPNERPDVRGSGVPGASMEGGMRMPPNGDDTRDDLADYAASMEGGMRMPPNENFAATNAYYMLLQWRAACACRRIRTMHTARQDEFRFNGGRHAHAAEFVACGSAVLGQGASMEGGMRMPPNGGHGSNVQPPGSASMEGGMRMPPNRSLRSGGLTWENGCKYERLQNGRRIEPRLSRDFCSEPLARACFEGSLEP